MVKEAAFEEDLKPGWHDRGYLPHFDVADKVQAVTFQLADSLPTAVLEGWRQEPADKPDKERQTEETRRLNRYLDAGLGECTLRQHRCAEIVEDALLHFDGDRYLMLEWVVMPNHVHAVLETADDVRVGDVVETWKKFTSRQINKVLGRSGRFWFRDYYDRWIRNDEHLKNAIAYVHANPVKAQLCQHENEWRWSSAWSGR